MREPFHPHIDDIRLTDVLHALSDPTRLAVVTAIAMRGECGCAMFMDLGVSPPTMSHHYAVLREAGVTRTRIDGKRFYLELRREELDKRFPGLLDRIIAAADLSATRAVRPRPVAVRAPDSAPPPTS